MAEETYHDIGKFDLPNELELVADQNRQFGYRNKMEYSFTEDDNGEISLAFFKRGHKQKIPIKHSQLAHPWLNSTAQQILDWINKTDMTTRNLKSLIIRSNEKKETIAGLFIKDELFFQDYPELNETLKGFQLYYSTHKSPASVPTKLIYSEGQDNLKESITPPNHQTAKGQQQKASLNLSYGLFSFFQVNVPLFETVLTDMLPYLDRDIEVVDFYSGVGAIGLSLADHFKIGTLVDNVDEAIEFAVQNIEENNVTNCQAFASPAEKMTELITSDKTIIFDTPRTGLNNNVVRKVMEEKQQTILYLSCNLSTQARDIEMLKDVYQPTFVKLYNFFPRTPHIEGLVVIVKRKD